MDKTKIVELLRSVARCSRTSRHHDLAQVAGPDEGGPLLRGTLGGDPGQSGVGFHLVVDGTAEVVKDGTRVARPAPRRLLRRDRPDRRRSAIGDGNRDVRPSRRSSLVGWDFRR